MERCPKCQSNKVHRSRTRSVVERFRKNLTGKAPFRCDACGWRGWGFDFGPTVERTNGRSFESNEPNLKALDEVLEREEGAGPLTS